MCPIRVKQCLLNEIEIVRRITWTPNRRFRFSIKSSSHKLIGIIEGLLGKRKKNWHWYYGNKMNYSQINYSPKRMSWISQGVIAANVWNASKEWMIMGSFYPYQTSILLWNSLDEKGLPLSLSSSILTFHTSFVALQKSCTTNGLIQCRIGTDCLSQHFSKWIALLWRAVQFLFGVLFL